MKVLKEFRSDPTEKRNRISRIIWCHKWSRTEVVSSSAGCDLFAPFASTLEFQVTPAHDQLDFAIGRDWGLGGLEGCLDWDGTLICPNLSFLHGLPRFKARQIILDRFSQTGQLKRRMPHPTKVRLLGIVGLVNENCYCFNRIIFLNLDLRGHNAAVGT